MNNFENLINHFAGNSPYVPREYMPQVMTELCKAVMADKTFFISVNFSPRMLEKHGKNHIFKTDLHDDDVEFSVNNLKAGEGEMLLPAFTSIRQAAAMGDTGVFEVDIYQFFDMFCENPAVSYAIINPFGKAVLVDKNMAQILLDQFE